VVGLYTGGGLIFGGGAYIRRFTVMNVDQWLSQNRIMIANVKKTKSMLIGSKPALKKAERICV
jgi:hypothetical protein